MSVIKPRTILFLVATGAIGLLAYAYYIQHYQDMAPCPLCVLQRYAFFGIAVFGLIGALGNATRLGGGLALASALGGGGTAIHHLWVLAHPGMSCGIDPMETALNRIFTAQLLPQMFKADGLCTTPMPPILGLSIPLWALISFVVMALLILWSLLQHRD